MPPAIQLCVVVDDHLAVRSGRNDRGGAPIVEFPPQPVGVERLVAQQGIEADTFDERSNTHAIVALPWQQDEADEVAQGVDQRDYFGRQTASRASDGIILSAASCAACL